MYIGDVPAGRPSSPIFMEANGVGNVKHPEMRRNGERDNFVHINRIPLIRTAVVSYLHADSPSCIWVRLTNHITDQLTVREPYDLDGVNIKDDVQVYDYFMAPIDNRLFGRCRILKIRNEVPRRMQVIFIDEGTTVWLSPDCLAKMDRDLFFHPWQAIAVSLCGVEMKREIKRDGHVPHEWTEEECIEFRQVIAEFKLLKTKTVKSSVVRNDYREPIKACSLRNGCIFHLSQSQLLFIKVELFGLRNEQDKDGVSISCLLAARTLGRLIPRRIINAALFKPDITPDYETLNDDDIPPFRRLFPSNWLRATSPKNGAANKVSEWDQWSPKDVVIPPLDIEWLDNNGYCDENSEYFVNVEGAHTISPYEFYARPVRRERVAVNGEENQIEADTKSMLSANNDLREKADVLDTFYSLEENRSALDKKEVFVRVFII
uniref:Tudor domain-containing protein n=1 Tax=Heterorhabditis bacteriophora TaxID=37862 RepID=A0A1I7XE66_HETBA